MGIRSKLVYIINNLALKPFGLEIRKTKWTSGFDMDKEFWEIHKKIEEFTMTSVEDLYAAYKAIEYICRNNISGDIVECGVWRGGTCMLFALTLIKFGDTKRKIYLYDTFTGITTPSEVDKFRIDGSHVKESLNKSTKSTKEANVWGYAPMEDVSNNMKTTGYPEDFVKFIQGPVGDTIPNEFHKEIAILRQDTDLYDTNKLGLAYLYPILVNGGVLFAGDYGIFEGVRKATDEFFADQAYAPLLNRVSAGCRLAIKLG